MLAMQRQVLESQSPIFDVQSLKPFARKILTMWVRRRARSGVKILNDWQSHIEYIDKIKIADNETKLKIHVTHVTVSAVTPGVYQRQSA